MQFRVPESICARKQYDVLRLFAAADARFGVFVLDEHARGGGRLFLDLILGRTSPP